MSVENVGYITSFKHTVLRKGYKMPEPHRHEAHELYYLMSGKSTYFISNRIYQLKAGDLIFVPKNRFHNTSYTTKNESERIALLITDRLFNCVLKSNIFNTSSPQLIRISPDVSQQIQDIFAMLELEQQHSDSFHEYIQEQLLCLLFSLISRNSLPCTDIELSPSKQSIQDAVQYIRANYSEDLNIADIAQMISMTPVYFSHQFKKLIGVSPSEYITMTRMNAAKKLLVDTNNSIVEISLACGYPDSNYFAKIFKMNVGITPKKYSLNAKKTQVNTCN